MSAGRRIAVPDDVDWRRMHPISPLLEGWKVVTAVVAVLTVRNVDNLVEAYRYATAHGLDLTRGVVRWAVAGTLLAGAAVVAVLFAQWWVTTYAVDRDGVYLRRGILVKRLRVARSPRIQSVDIVHPLLGRVFGLGQPVRRATSVENPPKVMAGWRASGMAPSRRAGSRIPMP